MHTIIDNFHQNGKYSAQIASHQAELTREENCIYQKSLNISSLQTDYLNLDSSSRFGINSDRAHAVQKNCTFCGGTNHSAENVSKELDKKRKKLVPLVLRKIDKRNRHLENVLDLDMMIT